MLEKEVAYERKKKLQVEEELAKNMNSHEEEVQLRVKFEDKLNNLH